MSNELRVGFTKSDAEVSQYLDNFGGASPINLAAAVGAGQSKSAQGYMYLDFPGVGTSQLFTGITSDGLRQENIVDTLSYSIGKHALKFGVDYRRIDSSSTYSSPSVVGIFLGAHDVLNNSATETEVDETAAASPIFQEFAAFAQDEWRVRPGLNLSLGVRWDADPAPTGANGQDGYTVEGSYAILRRLK
jgi:outer membrane receptor protein involved in Fe transport